MNRKINIVEKRDRQFCEFKIEKGSILRDINKVSRMEELFTVVGTSYDEIALVRMFEYNKMNDALAKKCCMLCHKIRLRTENITAKADCDKFQLPLYADLSILIIKEYPLLTHVLSEHPEKIVGNIHKFDLEYFVHVIQDINTISSDVKNRLIMG